jgi:hypothetical protein
MGKRERMFVFAEPPFQASAGITATVILYFVHFVQVAIFFLILSQVVVEG